MGKKNVEDPTSVNLNQIAAKTLCQESFEMVRKCAEANSLRSATDIARKDGFCSEQWQAFASCRDRSVPQVVQWSMIAPGCEELKDFYMECMENVAQGSSADEPNAHRRCQSHFEKLVACGSAAILADLEQEEE